VTVNSLRTWAPVASKKSRCVPVIADETVTGNAHSVVTGLAAVTANGVIRGGTAWATPGTTPTTQSAIAIGRRRRAAEPPRDVRQRVRTGDGALAAPAGPGEARRSPPMAATRLRNGT
jgi:hypothetical protein